METVNKIKQQIQLDELLPTVLKGISIEAHDNSNMGTKKLATAEKENSEVFNLILSFHKPISKCL